MLRIIFHNILVNAAQAMHGDGIVRIGVQSIDGACRASVTDDGPGIPAELHEQIFVPFFTTKSRGSGLGLPTARCLVEAHGGSIGVDSAANGTTVTVSLPASTDRVSP